MDIEKDAAICPICGYEFPEPSRSTGIVALLMILLLLLWLIF